MKPPFYYKNNRLFCEKIDITDFSKTVPTPFYIYSRAEIEHNCQAVWQAAMQDNSLDFMPYYALKANYNPGILKLIKAQGFGADIVSAGELYFAEKTGFPADKIVFAGVGKSKEEIREAVQKGLHSINIESSEELKSVADIARKEQKTQRIAIRINPDIEAKTHEYISTGLHKNKFGVSADQAFKLYLETRKYKNIIADGIHVHIGSQISLASPFKATGEYLKTFVQRLAAEKIIIKFLDLGGGIGINYDDPLTNTDSPRTYIETILPQYLASFAGLNLKLFVELGRSIIGSAGLLVSKILIRKHTPLKQFMVVDAAMNNLIRPSLYQAHHQIVPLEKGKYKSITADIVGPVCESGDFLAKDISIEDLPTGEKIAVGSAGAYGQVLASNYNLRPTISEYLVDGAEISTIFKGRTIADIANSYTW